MIIVLKDGQVYEQGTHESLMRLGGLYRDMWVAQQEAPTLAKEVDSAVEEIEAPKVTPV